MGLRFPYPLRVHPDPQSFAEQFVYRRRIGNGPINATGDHFSCIIFLKLERATAWQHSLEAPGNYRFFFVDVLLSQAALALSDLTHVHILENIVIEFNRAHSFMVNHHSQEGTQSAKRSRIGFRYGICQHLISSNRCLKDRFCLSDGRLNRRIVRK